MIAKGAEVTWSWGSGKHKGIVKEIIEKEMELDINGAKVKTAGTQDAPFYLIEKEDGSRILKSSKEVNPLH